MATLKNGIFAFITTIISVISFTATFSPPVSAEILYFGPGALPTCAYECIPLWSAQYDCPEETTPGECFCKSKHLAPLLKGTPGSICEDQCPADGEGAKIKTWFDSVCVSFLIRQTTSTSTLEPTQTTDSPNPKDTSGSDDFKITESSNDQDDPKQENRAIEWWKKNWYWFLIAFLAITIPITVYALWFPCRKWTRRQIIQRRSRAPLPPVGPMSINNNNNPYANGGLASPGPPPIPSGIFTNQQWADPYSPSLTRDGIGYFPHYVAPQTPSPLGAVRQESWERRVREEFEGKKSIGERLAFWKSNQKGGGGEEGKIEGPGQAR